MTMNEAVKQLQQFLSYLLHYIFKYNIRKN